MKAKVISALVALLLLVPGGMALAQDEEPEPVVLIQETSDVEQSIYDGLVTVSVALGWFIAFAMAWQLEGIALSIVMEDTIKPRLNWMVGSDSALFEYFGEHGRVVVLFLVAMGAGIYQASILNIDLLGTLPLPIFDETPPDAMIVMNGILVGVGSKIGHHESDWFISRAKRAKGAVDTLINPNDLAEVVGIK